MNTNEIGKLKKLRKNGTSVKKVKKSPGDILETVLRRKNKGD